MTVEEQLLVTRTWAENLVQALAAEQEKVRVLESQLKGLLGEE